MGKESLPWRSWERYVILAYNEHNDDLTEETGQNDRQEQQLRPGDIDNRVHFSHHPLDPAVKDCSTSLEQSLNELQLMRIELRSRSVGDEEISDHEQRLLYLGDVHTDRKQRPYYRPQSYQQPLFADDDKRVRRRLFV